MIAKTKDGRAFATDGEPERLVGSVARSHCPPDETLAVHVPAKVGEFPVCYEPARRRIILYLCRVHSVRA